MHPLMDRLQRKDDVNGLAGPNVVLPKYVPIDFFLIPTKIRDIEDCIQAIRYCDRLCTLISVQTSCVKNRALLKVALIQHTFSQVVLQCLYCLDNIEHHHIAHVGIAYAKISIGSRLCSMLMEDSDEIWRAIGFDDMSRAHYGAFHRCLLQPAGLKIVAQR
jgi:hypothetical protein